MCARGVWADDGAELMIKPVNPIVGTAPASGLESPKLYFECVMIL